MRRCLLRDRHVRVFTVFALERRLRLVASKRVALVIGNSAYAACRHASQPGRRRQADRRDAAQGRLHGDRGHPISTRSTWARLLDQFTEAAYDADIAVVYYAGHGLQVDGRNYLIPVDAELEKAAQLQTRTIPVEDVLAALPPDPAVGVIILDACRDNPLARTLAAALPRAARMGAGLAPVQANGLSHDAGGLLIAYATDPGAVAYDGKDAHSPYTTALARHLATPGLEIQSALTRVRAEVSEATNGAQRPWHNASLAREVFIGGAARRSPEAGRRRSSRSGRHAAAAAPARPADVDWTVEQKLWDEASKRNTVAHYELYLSQYPQGRFADVARLNLDQLKEAEASAGTAAPTRRADRRWRSASQSRTAVGVSDEVKQTPGTPADRGRAQPRPRRPHRPAAAAERARATTSAASTARSARVRARRSALAAPERHRRDDLSDAAAAYVPGGADRPDDGAGPRPATRRRRRPAQKRQHGRRRSATTDRQQDRRRRSSRSPPSRPRKKKPRRRRTTTFPTSRATEPAGRQQRWKLCAGALLGTGLGLVIGND